ncbi:DEAD/DEAH box helicase [Butyrivibrio sp. MC2013]|uniref:DEAD/DEAH box helicase n=1 Tax=Butyrivibrio sp. MC2013 TaxID=1280686 RepID=UPI0018CA15C7|nr:DEAD/DEAH box helicase [Butyrivibrio sp. MC2013]
MKKSIHEAESLDALLLQLIEEEDKRKEELLLVINKLHYQKAYELLGDMSVDKLSEADSSIRVAPLKKAGITNIRQVLDASHRQLLLISGIGEQGAANIKAAADGFLESMAKTAYIHINADRPSEADIELVHMLFRYLNQREISREADKIYKAEHEGIVAAINGLSCRNYIKWIFTSSDNKYKVQEAFTSLLSILAGGLGDKVYRLQGLSTDLMNYGTDTSWQGFMRSSAAYYAVLETIDQSFSPAPLSGSFPARLADEIMKEEPDLSMLNVTLRPYQDFGCKYILHQKRVLLGDEMGLGKTIQAIAAISSLAAGLERGHFLVVCPASVLINWEREIRKHSELKSIMIHGSQKYPAAEEWVASGGVAVTNYESVDEILEKTPRDFYIDMLVADEAHYVKNPEAKRTIYLKKICGYAERILFMTGTPLENNVAEFCNLLEILQPEIAAKARQNSFMNDIPQFREMLSPAYLRRNREDVLKELPELNDKAEWCEMTDEDRLAYQQALQGGAFMTLRRVAYLQDDPLTSSKIRRLLEICEQARADHRKIIVFSYYLDTLDKVMRALGDICLPMINGSISPMRRQEIVDKFNEAEDGAVLPDQIQAGGTGLNIQAASIVIFCEPQIKPSLEQQALSRAYRMGQVRSVFVHHLLCENTIDDEILSLLEEKETIFDNYADQSAMGHENMKLENNRLISEIIERERQKYLPAPLTD